MPTSVLNSAAAADINIWGFYALFRPKTALSSAVSATDTEISVENAHWFAVGDTLILGRHSGDSEEATISTISGNTITLDSSVTNGYSAGDPVRRQGWWHLGHVRNPDRTQDRTVQEIQSAIGGKLQKVKEIISSVSKGLSFESISAASAIVQALHTGNPSHTGVISDTTVLTDDVNAVSGELMLVQLNAETGGVAIVEFKPDAQMSGDGYAQGSDGESETALQFTTSFNSDDNYTVPAALVADEPDAPLGVIVKTSEASRESVMDVFSDLTA